MGGANTRALQYAWEYKGVQSLKLSSLCIHPEAHHSVLGTLNDPESCPSSHKDSTRSRRIHTSPTVNFESLHAKASLHGITSKA